MPLAGGYTREVVYRNAAELVRAGYSEEQAFAIAFSEARESARNIKDKHRREAVMRRLRKRGK